MNANIEGKGIAPGATSTTIATKSSKAHQSSGSRNINTITNERLSAKQSTPCSTPCSMPCTVVPRRSLPRCRGRSRRSRHPPCCRTTWRRPCFWAWTRRPDSAFEGSVFHHAEKPASRGNSRQNPGHSQENECDRVRLEARNGHVFRVKRTSKCKATGRDQEPKNFDQG